jgi:hypothetical protein
MSTLRKVDQKFLAIGRLCPGQNCRVLGVPFNDDVLLAFILT